MDDPLAALRGDETISRVVVDNAEALLRLAPTDLMPERGVFPTIRLFWSTSQGVVEAEVFEEYFEVYPAGFAPTDIWAEAFSAEDPLPERFRRALG